MLDFRFAIHPFSVSRFLDVRKCRFSAKKGLTFSFMMRLTPAKRYRHSQQSQSQPQSQSSPNPNPQKPTQPRHPDLVWLIFEVQARLALKMYIENNINFYVWLTLTANLITLVMGFLRWVPRALPGTDKDEPS